jgi:hypothetical protein
VRRAALVGTILLALLAAGCGSSSGYTEAKTRDCLESRGVTIGGRLDFVASTATGGAFAAKLGDNSVKVVFGETENDAKQIDEAYRRFANPNVKAGIDDVLRRDRNVVMLWGQHPQESDLSLIEGCLK